MKKITNDSTEGEVITYIAKLLGSTREQAKGALMLSQHAYAAGYVEGVAALTAESIMAHRV